VPTPDVPEGGVTKVSNISQRRTSALSDGGAEYTATLGELVHIAAKLFKELGFSPRGWPILRAKPPPAW